MKVKIECPYCFGQNVYCEVCKGEGFILIDDSIKKADSSCVSCGGRGWKTTEGKAIVCEECRGKGKK